MHSKIVNHDYNYNFLKYKFTTIIYIYTIFINISQKHSNPPNKINLSVI